MNTFWSWWERNWLVGAALTGSAETATRPVANVVDPALARPWRVPARSATLDADCGAARPFQVFGLFGMRNATAAMQVRISLSASSPGGDDVWGSGWQAAGILRGFDQWTRVLPAPLQARHCRIEIEDAGNPNDFLLVGLAWAGDGFEAAMNPAPGLTPAHDDPSPGTSVPGGQVYLDRKRLVRVTRGTYARLPRDQALGPVTDLIRSGSAASCLYVPCGPHDARLAVCGLLRKSHVLPRQDGDIHDWHRFDFEIRERL